MPRYREARRLPEPKRQSARYYVQHQVHGQTADQEAVPTRGLTVRPRARITEWRTYLKNTTCGHAQRMRAVLT